MTYNLGAGNGNAKYLSQNELFNLNKQKNLKIGLKNALMALDPGQTKTIAVDKFQIEAENVGIHLSQDDIGILLNFYEDKDAYNYARNVPAINYELALKSIVPLLQRNSDKSVMARDLNRDFKIGWSVSKNLKHRL